MSPTIDELRLRFERLKSGTNVEQLPDDAQIQKRLEDLTGKKYSTPNPAPPPSSSSSAALSIDSTIPPLSSITDPELQSLLMTQDLLTSLGSDVPVGFEDDLRSLSVPNTPIAPTDNEDDDELKETKETISSIIKDLKKMEAGGKVYVDYTDAILTSPTKKPSSFSLVEDESMGVVGIVGKEKKDVDELLSKVSAEIELEKGLKEVGGGGGGEESEFELRVKKLAEFKPETTTTNTGTNSNASTQETNKDNLKPSKKAIEKIKSPLGAPPSIPSLRDFGKPEPINSSNTEQEEEYCCICVEKAQVECEDCEEFYCVKCWNKGHLELGIGPDELRLHKPIRRVTNS
ncbi:hypothetical protein HDV05_000272 [Chytridiales sp. JEL 0842]|nr:hypothetical protein HDV05_000272 [Chytridiales sp. JEL 0842]